MGYVKYNNMKIIKYLVIIIIIASLVATGYFLNTLNSPNSITDKITNFEVKEGWGSQKISQELKQAGLVRNYYVFEIYVWFKGLNSKLLPGNYALANNLTMPELAQILTRERD